MHLHSLCMFCSETDGPRFVNRLSEMFSRLIPRVLLQWSRRIEPEKTLLFSKHSYFGEQLIIYNRGPTQPRFIVPQKTGHQRITSLYSLVLLLLYTSLLMCH